MLIKGKQNNGVERTYKELTVYKQWVWEWTVDAKVEKGKEEVKEVEGNEELIQEQK